MDVNLKAIISGFQSGADMGGILAAAELGISTGGWMPKGWITERGPKPEYESFFGATEADSSDYLVRTRMNVELADATVIFGRRSPGSNRTEEFTRVAGKPCMWVFWPEMVQPGVNTEPRVFLALFRIWRARHKVSILNCAGNRESVNPGIQEFVKSFLIKALQ